jgi:protein TonB
MKKSPEKFGGGLLMALGLHALLAVTLFILPGVFPAYGITGWGSEEGGGEGVSVEIVSNISGIPLPAPAVVNETAAANESAGFFESETAPAPEETPATEVPVPEAEPVPETLAPVETTPPPPSPTPAAREVPDAPVIPDNAVPFGEGGLPAISYGQFAAGDGTGAISVGDGAFGELYGSYVESITRRVSENWLQSMITGNVRQAPRIYVSFDILRAGTIINEKIEKSSGIPSLDRSAMRAIFASNPLAPLPGGFRGRSVNVRFWFEYKR